MGETWYHWMVSLPMTTYENCTYVL